MIWFALFIPLVTALILAIFFARRTKWWEFAIPFIVSLLLIGASKWIGENFGTKDHEVWGGWVISSHYYEAWNEWITQMCPVTTCVGTGKSEVCTTTMVDCSHSVYHPARWDIIDSNRAEHDVNQKTYNYFVNLFGSPQFVDMHRDYYTKDGDMYQVLWPKTEATLEPVTTDHTYENRVQASRSVFNYQKISDKEAKKDGLFQYPEVTLFNYPAILGNCGPNTKEANKKLSLYNAELGAKKELRMWVLCTSSADPEFGQLQESYWVGGNKNEVVLVLGKGWDHIFSWTDNKEPLIEIRDFAATEQDPVKVVDFMAAKLKASFIRKQFADFSYLTVETPTWCVVLTFLLTLAVNVGLSYFIVVNEWNDEPVLFAWERNSLRRRRRSR